MREGNSFWQRGSSTFQEEIGTNMNTNQGYGDRNRQFSASDADNEQHYGEQNFEDRDRRNHNFDRERRGQNFDRDGRGQNFEREGHGQNYDRNGRGQNFERDGHGQNFDREGKGQNYERDNRGQNFEEREGGRYDGSRGMVSQPNEVGPRSMRGDGIGSSNSRSSGGMGPHNSGPPGGMGSNQPGGFNAMGPNQPGGFSGMGPHTGGFPGIGPSPPGMPGGGMNMPRPMGTGGGPQLHFGGGNNSEADIVSSFQTFSQMTAQSDIASKIISAVLSTVPNLSGNPIRNPLNLQPGNIPFPGGPVGPGPMGMNNFNNQSVNRPFRNNMNKFEDRRAYPRHSSPPKSSRFSGSSRDRFKDDRRGKRSSVSSSRGSTRGRFDRSPDIKKRLDYKSSKRERDDKVKTEPLNSKRRRLSGEKTDSDKKKEVHGKETVAKSKRSDTEDESKSSDEKIVDKEKNKEGDSGVKKKKWIEIPPAALFCHICNQGKFTSEQTYLYHLEGVRHKKTANSFWDKNDSTLEYLRKNAKLASIRFGGFDNSFTPSTCNICFAVVKESFKNHKRLLEHKLVSRFLMPRCCGRRFKSRHDMDEHRLSLPHLRRIYEKNQAKNVALEESENQGNTTFNEVMSQLQKKITADMEEISLVNMPPFDGNQMIGINFLEAKESVLCKPCQMLLPIGAKSLEGHLVSLSHYNAMQEYLITNKSKENKDKDGKPNVDDSTAVSTTNTKLKREREEKDTDEEDSDDDDLARHIARSDAEDDDDLPYIDESNHIVLEEVDDNDDKDKSNEESNYETMKSELKDGEEMERGAGMDEDDQRDEDEPQEDDEQQDGDDPQDEEDEEAMEDEEPRDGDEDESKGEDDQMDEVELLDE